MVNKDFIDLYFEEKINLYQNIDRYLILKLYDLVKDVYLKSGYIFFAANGGPSGIVQNAVTDLRFHPFVSESKQESTNLKKLKVIDFSESSGALTGISNDLGFENVFSEQLKNYLDDKTNNNSLTIMFSGSGNSKNIVNLCKLSNNNGIKTFSITGRGGGELKKISKYCLNIEGSSNFPGQTGKNDNNFHIEDIQNSIIHIITGLLKNFVNPNSN
tara:strand:+ start:3225 stop:3869 length:645 start_codon:yes stop_codon:yes gene_type:complete